MHALREPLLDIHVKLMLYNLTQLEQFSYKPNRIMFRGRMFRFRTTYSSSIVYTSSWWNSDTFYVLPGQFFSQQLILHKRGIWLHCLWNTEVLVGWVSEQKNIFLLRHSEPKFCWEYDRDSNQRLRLALEKLCTQNFERKHSVKIFIGTR